MWWSCRAIYNTVCTLLSQHNLQCGHLRLNAFFKLVFQVFTLQMAAPSGVYITFRRLWPKLPKFPRTRDDVTSILLEYLQSSTGMWVLLPSHICNEYTDKVTCRLTWLTRMSAFLFVINRSLAVLTDYRISRNSLPVAKIDQQGMCFHWASGRSQCEVQKAESIEQLTQSRSNLEANCGPCELSLLLGSLFNN